MAPMTHALVVTPCRRFALSAKIPDTKGCLQCRVGKSRVLGAGGAEVTATSRSPSPASLAVRNPYTGSTFLLAALPASLLLLQWYEPLQKFLLLKVRHGGGGGEGCGRDRGDPGRQQWAWGEKWRPEHRCCPQNFSSPLPSPAGMLEPLVLDGKELPQVCVGAEGPEGPGCRVLFHVLPLEAGLTPDVLIPPGKPEGCV